MTKKIFNFITLLLITLTIILHANFIVAQEVNPQTNQDIPQEVNQEIKQNIDQEIKEYPVSLDGETLFVIKENFGPISAEERAKEINKKLKNLAEDPLFFEDTIKSLEDDNITFIFSDKLSQESIILTITENDAKAEDATEKELSEKYINKIQESIAKYREERNSTNIVRGLFLSLISTLILIIVLWLFNSFLGEIYNNFNSGERKLNGITIRGIELISGERLTNNIIGLIKNIKLLLNFGLIVIYLSIVSSFFPTTKLFSLQIWNYFFNAIKLISQNFIEYLPNLFILTIIFLLSSNVIRLIKPIFENLEKGTITMPGFYPEWAEPTYKLIEIFIIIFTAIMMFPYLPGFGSQAFQNVSILLGVLVSLGSTAAVSNAVAGIILIYTRAFQIGDRVRLGEYIGDVEDKSILVTRIRTFENMIITIPNSTLLSNNIINYSASIREKRIPIIITGVITLGYDVSWQKIYETLIKAALDTSYILEEPRPFVLQTGLGDFSVTYELKAYTNSPTKMELIYSELYQNMQDKCNEADIEILSPTYSAVRDGNTSTIPENYLSKDYESPGFQLNPLGSLFQIDLNLTPNNNKKQS